MHAILIATAALAGLPILLHLIMKQEPKRLPFPAFRFLVAKRRTNQRKLKLRHFLLLALRVLLIALFGLALFQPVLPSAGLGFGITLAGEQPVAAVLVIDTSPSMGYAANNQTRLAEARRRALELLAELPANSRVAVLDPAEPGGSWEQSVGDARRKIEAMTEPRGAAVPVTTALGAAYQLLRTVDQEAEQAEPLPRLVAVFSDRTAACWDATRTEDLKKLRDLIPLLAVSHLFVDVGIDQPADVGITSIELKPQIVPQGTTVVLNATLSAAGPAVEATVKCKILSATTVPEQTAVVAIPANGANGVAFRIDATQLPPGVHQAEIRLTTADKLAFNDVRYMTFKVAEPRNILTLADDPEDAEFWRLAHFFRGEFDCDVKKPADAGTDFSAYEAVCLLNVADPTSLWPKLLPYVEGGGKLIVMPGERLLPSAYSPTTTEAAGRLLPAKLTTVFNTEDLPKERFRGVSWLTDDTALRHPMLAVYRDWKLRGNVDIVLAPRRAWKFWQVEPVPEAGVIARYDDTDDDAKRRPALLERAVGARGGKVVLMTTRMDTPPVNQRWNDYWDFGNSWVAAFPNMLLRYLAGDPSDAVFNFVTGQPVPLPVPRAAAGKLQLEGPGVTVRDAEIPLDGRQTEVRLSPARTSTAGNFRLFTPDRKWQDGFSLNAPAEESVLTKVPVEAVENLFGPGTVVPLDKAVKLRDVIVSKFDQPVDLFPWLLIAVLLLLACEGLVANRFYRVTR